MKYVDVRRQTLEDDHTTNQHYKPILFNTQVSRSVPPGHGSSNQTAYDNVCGKNVIGRGMDGFHLALNQTN